MKRLVDEGLDDAARDPAIRMLRAARPLRPSKQMKQRVRMAMASAARPVHVRGLPRPAIVTVLILGLLGIASAMSAWWNRTSEPQQVLPPARSSVAPQPPAIRGSDLARPILPPSRAVESHSTSLAARPVHPAQAANKQRRGLPAAAAAASAQAAPTATAPAEERRAWEGGVVPKQNDAAKSDDLGFYLEGIRALRQARDFRRAGTLFQLYRQGNPSGSFVEESWALSIEAAAELGQSPRELAEDYLARFPQGRFRALAKKALSR